jgi:queuine tRNA-ribosyltransferase
MFQISAKDKNTKARTGILKTAHADIPTPVFMPVGTMGTIKGILQRDLENDLDVRIILGNTYHLYLRPGVDIMKSAGGLHNFMKWKRALLTDSGGYQVFSLNEIRKVTHEGVKFRSYIDGSEHLFTPENTIDIQRIIGADIIMALDECTPYPCDYKYAQKSMELTHQWLDRSVKRFMETDPLWGYDQFLFPIIQGSTYDDLRRQSAAKASMSGMEGIAIGGLSVGEPADEMYRIIEVVNEILPEDKPRYLMGVGTPVNILEAVERGVDMFDCVMPTRNGRNGMIFTSNGIINIRNSKWANDFSVLDDRCPSYVSSTFSKAYLRHLVISGEMLGAQIATMQNLSFYLYLMNEARKKIEEGDFLKWKEEITEDLSRRL